MKPGKSSARVKLSLVGTVGLFVAALVLLLPSVARARQAATPKRVVVLYWYNREWPGQDRFDQSFQAALESEPAGTVEYYSEYLESNRFPGKNQSLLLRDYLRQKYADRTIDVVVANTDVPLDFLLKYRNDLFTHTPIVFVAARPPSKEVLAAGPGLTGIINKNDYRDTLDLALRLHPGTEQVFVVSGTLEHDKRFEIQCREEFRDYESRVSFTYLTDLPQEELVFKTKSLPERSIVLYVYQQFRNDQGNILETRDILALVADSTPVPIYGLSSWKVGRGIVGGYVRTLESIGTRAAQIALRIAKGERAQDIPIENVPVVPIFDWRELKRWGISEERLPPGSIVRFKELSFWEEYKGRIIGVISLCLLQAGLIAVLLFERSRRKRAKEALDDRLRFETLLSDLSADFTDLRSDEADSKIEEWLQRLVRFLGVDRGCFIHFLIVGEQVHHKHSCAVPGIGQAPEIDLTERVGWYVDQLGRGTVLNYSHLPDQLPAEAVCEKRQFREAGLKSHLAIPVLSGGSVVYTLSITALDSHRSWSEDLVARLRLVGEIFANALMRKQAEEDLIESHARIEDLAGRLIVAHEDERKNIARELHDDLNQHVAALAISLGKLERQLPEADDSIRNQITKLEQKMTQLSERIRQLSHQLHSSTLEHVGLPEALKLHCAEFTDREGISVTLNIQDGMKAIPADAALCIYRVAQESLRNIAKHSGARIAEVMLNATGEELELCVADQGMGFDQEDARSRRGLGLVSIEERVKLLHGSFEVKSQPGVGTELRVYLPLRNYSF